MKDGIKKVHRVLLLVLFIVIGFLLTFWFTYFYRMDLIIYGLACASVYCLLFKKFELKSLWYMFFVLFFCCNILFPPVSRFFAKGSCLDRGGRWNTKNLDCSFIYEEMK